MLKIALTGKFRSGKDAVAERLFYEHGFEWPIAFGSKMKYHADRIFVDLIEEDRKNRAVYQEFAQSCRAIFEDVWIKHVEFSVNEALNSRTTSGIVIKDLRQPNEYEWCKRNGFVIVRVTAPEDVRIRRAKWAGDDFTMDDLAHETESYVDSFEVDYEIANDGSLDELYAKVDELITSLIEI